MYVWVGSFCFKQKNKRVIIVKLSFSLLSAIFKKILLCKHFYKKLLTPSQSIRANKKN